MHSRGIKGLLLGLVGLLTLAGCSNPRVAALPAPETPETAPRDWPAIPAPNPAAVKVPPGYRVEVVMTDLVYPSSVEFDDSGNMYVAEAGYVYGDPYGVPRILRVSRKGRIEVLTDRLNGPVTDLLWHDGKLYVSHMGKISTVSASGEVSDLVTGLPSQGDHHNNQLAMGPDGKLYFGQGTVTNSGVVGLDNFLYLWLPYYPTLHDQPAKDIELTNEQYITANAFVLAGNFDVWSRHDTPVTRTAAFHPYGRGLDNRTVRGVTKANGTILRLNPDGSDLEVYAWGLRNPFGVAWGPDGQLYATENGFDERGSRPIANDPDDLYVIKEGAWYGWPDYAAGIPVTDPRFTPEGGPKPQFLMKNHPPVEKPLTTFPPHSAAAKIAFSKGNRFGPEHHMFIPMFGPGTPMTGKQHEVAALGPQVVRVDPQNRTYEAFFAGRAPNSGKLEDAATPGPRRPVDVVFAQRGDVMYIADIGALPAVETPVPLLRPFPGTGVIWRVVPDGVRVQGPPANLTPVRRVSR